MRAFCDKNNNIESFREWENLKRGYKVQEKRAKELHALAGVKEGPCGLAELESFQKVLYPDYQLMGMCRSKPFNIIFRDPEAPNVIRIIKSNFHYNGCTKFSGFVNRSYWCDRCCKGFDHDDIRHHSCGGRICRACHSETCPDYRIGTTPNLLCHLCNALFFGDTCMRTHLIEKLGKKKKDVPSLSLALCCRKRKAS